MRAGIVVVGILLIIIGAVLMFVPLLSSASVNLSSSQPEQEVNVSGFSITGGIPATLSWTSNQPVNVSVATCSSVAGNGTCKGTVSLLSAENGTSGSFSFNVPAGGGIGVGMVGGDAATASVTIKLAQTTVGLIVLVIGVILFLVGAAVRRKVPPPPPPPPPAAPAAPPPM
jgi:uncharacterized membrane protein